MQIVIDIPQEDYNYIQEVDNSNYAITNRLYDAVAKGTPLPKGHGRLIDEIEVLDNIKTRLWQTALNNTEVITSYDKTCEDIVENRIDTWVSEMRTIIEADDEDME